MGVGDSCLSPTPRSRRLSVDTPFWPAAFFISEVRGLASYLFSLWDVRDLVLNAGPAVQLWVDSVTFLCFHCLICDTRLSGFTEVTGPCLTWGPRPPTKGVFIEHSVSPK